MGFKVEVVNWFKGLSASNRLDTVCVLLDHCVTVELRFLLIVIENLGKRDFHELRDVEHKANSLSTIRANLYLNDKMTLVSPMCEPSTASVNSHFVQPLNPSANSFNQVNDTSTNRPSPTHHLERKTRSPGPGGCQTAQVSQSAESQILSMVSMHNSESSYTSSGSKGGHHLPSGTSNSNQIPTGCRVNSGEEDEEEYKSDPIMITDELRRKRLIMYLCLLKPSNLECAKVYYRILTEVDVVLNSPGWLDGLDETTLEEFAMLYTVGNKHPSFTFEQRTFLGEKMNLFQNQIMKLERGKSGAYPQPTYYLPQTHGYYILPHCPGQAPQGNNPTTENGRTVERFFMPPYAPHMPLFVTPYHHPVQANQQATHPYAQNMIGAAVSPQATAGSPVTPNQTLLQQQPVPLSGPSSSSSSSSIQQFPKAQQAATQSQQGSGSTPTRSLSNTITAFQSQTNSLDGNESEECLWDSPESSPFESPPQSLTPSRSDSPTVAQRNTVTQSSAAHPSHAPFPLTLPMAVNSAASCNSIPENLCSTTSIATAIGAGIGGTAIGGLNPSRPNKIGNNSQVSSPFIHAQDVNTGGPSGIKPLTISAVNLALNGLKITSNDRRTAKQPPVNSIIYSSNPSSNNCVHIPPSMMPQPHHQSSVSSGTTASAHAMTMTSSSSNNPSPSQIQQNNSSHSQQFVHSSQSQYVNSGNSVLTSVNSSCLGTAARTPSGSTIPVTSIMNCGNGRNISVSTNSGNVYNHIQNSNISSTLVAFHHPVSLPIAQQHHTQANTGGGGTPDGSNSVYGNTVKTLPPLMPSHARLKPNSSSNPSNAMNTSAMLAQSQQIMAQVQNPPPAAVNSVGVGTHSISTNASLVNYQHGPMPLGGPQVNNYGGVAYPNVGAPPYSSMGFRSPNNQQTIISSRTATYIPHNNPMMNNQIVLKQQQDQRSHNLSSGMNHGRPKANTSGVQAQNTPKRRNTGSTNTSNSSNTNMGSNGGNGNQHNMQCKGEDTTENESCLS